MKFARSGALLLWVALAVSVPTSGQEPAASTEASAETNSNQAAAAAGSQASVPITGSQIPREEVQCAACHTEPALWEGDKQRLFIPTEGLQHDVHWQKGVGCSDCHGGDHTSLNYAEAHAGMVALGQLKQRCSVCHKEQNLGLLKGVHAKAGDKDDRGRGLPLDCVKCHGANAHEIFPAKDERSPVYLNYQVRTCGSCHPEDQTTYSNTVHGRGLYQSGLKVTAVCADCHGAHGIYYAADRRSSLHVSNVAATCSKCHQFIEERLARSVHGRDGGVGSVAKQPAAGGKTKRNPTCSDCHEGHHLLHSELAEFRLQVANNCGNCHADLSSRFALSMHGELTHQGYSAAANCADCHGSHDILPIDDPNSKLAPGENRLHTCQKCHLYAVSNFTDFDPHADFKDAARYPKLHAVYNGIKYTVNFFFACFLLHAFLWFIRALVHRLQHGGHATLVADQYALPRFGPIHGASFATLIVAFFGLTTSGLALKYSDQNWGRWLAQIFGGFRSASVWHHFFAVLAIVAVVMHLARAAAGIGRLRQERTWKAVVLGLDSLVPNGRDLRDLGKMVLWFIGFGRKPAFERWTYWEKLDYWAFCLAAGLIGISGLMSWYPNVFCVVLPGSILNVAKVVHSEFAIYIASFLFLIHYFHAHFRPEKFPMDLSVLTGMVSEQHLRKYRPEYIARLEREGKLDEMRITAPSRRNLWLNIVGGILVFTLGLCLLAVTLLASLGE